MKTPLLLLTCLLGQLLASAQESQLKLDSFYSHLLNRTVNFYILLPPGYDGTSERYPSVYMLRGSEWEWITPTQDGSRGGRDIQTVAADLYTKGQIGKMVYVMPGLSAPGTDAELNEIALEMFSYVDSVYRTIPTRWQRGVDGFSYGGLDVMNLITLQPHAFHTAGSYDGSYWAFDMGRILTAPPEAIQQMKSIRFMHHSGGEAFASTTNFESVAELVSVMASRGLGNEFSVIPLSPSAIHSWWWADEHMMVTLPLHWQSFQDTTHNIPLHLLTPAPGAHLAGTVNVQWSVPALPASSKILLQYSSDKGKTWKNLFAGSSTVSSFSWNTNTVPDGTWYLLRLSATADTAYGLSQLTAPFTIDNPGNGAPAVEILSPTPGTTMTGLANLRWSGSDPEGDQLTYSIDLSTNGGLWWEPVASGLSGVGQYAWDSRLGPNSNSSSLRIRCTDGLAQSEATITGLKISNPRGSVAASSVLHVAGHGDGRVTPHVVSPQQILPHVYQVTFRDSLLTGTRFDVRDLTRDSLLLASVPIGGAGNESPPFHGLRLEITQYQQAVHSADSSRWLTGSSNLKPQVTLPQLVTGSGTVKGFPYPADYLITIFDHVVDTSSSYLDATPTPMKFTVRNLTDDRKTAVVFSDVDGNSQVSMLDEIVFLEPGQPLAPLVTWDLFFQETTNPVSPQPGDRYLVRILKPLSSRDTIRFTPTVTEVADLAGPEQPERFALYQNFPNPFNPSTTIDFDLPRAGHVRMVIFNILGQAVATPLDAPAPAGRHRVRWDASSVASGVYFVRVEAGEWVAVKRMMLLK